jgi:hypothetical protein
MWETNRMNVRHMMLAVPLLVVSFGPVSAEVDRFDVLAREQPALQGRAFGDSGTVEKITARATIALDPADPHNAVIVDLDRAPRSPNAKVMAQTDVVILRPAHPNGTLLFEVLNRGRKLTPGYFDDTDSTSGSRLEQADDATIEITRPNGAASGALYELAYTAREPRVMGMGLAAIRDVASFLRHEVARRTRWPWTAVRASVGP